MSFEALLERLDRIIGEAKPELRPAMIKHLENIRQSVTEVLPKLAGVYGFDDNLYHSWRCCATCPNARELRFLAARSAARTPLRCQDRA